MKIRWRYSQVIEILEYDLCNEIIVIKILSCGVNEELEINSIYKIDYSNERHIPDIEKLIKLIENQLHFYISD